MDSGGALDFSFRGTALGTSFYKRPARFELYEDLPPYKGYAERAPTGPISRGATASIGRLELSEFFPNQRRGDVFGRNGIKLGIVGREWIGN